MLRKIILTLLLACFVSLPIYSYAEEGVMGKAVEETKEVAKDTGKVAKKKWRAAKDKGCEMVNGKMECAAKKLKHKGQNLGDEVKDKVDDVSK